MQVTEIIRILSDFPFLRSVLFLLRALEICSGADIAGLSARVACFLGVFSSLPDPPSEKIGPPENIYPVIGIARREVRGMLVFLTAAPWAI